MLFGPRSCKRSFCGTRVSREQIQVTKKDCRVTSATSVSMWDNTRPMKGISAIHVMNEPSFMDLLMFAQPPGSPMRAHFARLGVKAGCGPLSPLFPTATLEAL